MPFQMESNVLLKKSLKFNCLDQCFHQFLDCEQSLFCSKIRRENERDGMRDIRAARAVS